MFYCCAILGVLLSSVLSSQTITGSITGSVPDPAKAVVAAAKIVATNTGTNLTYSTTTHETGVYILLFLPAGPVTTFSFCAAGVDDNACAFGIPAVGELGSVGVGTLRAPSFFNLDASVSKKFMLTEWKYIQFRTAFFNALNHASWGPPGRNITSPTSFGQITSHVQNPCNIQFD